MLSFFPGVSLEALCYKTTQGGTLGSWWMLGAAGLSARKELGAEEAL